MSINPLMSDALFGAVCAAIGIKETTTLIHGPVGCRYFIHSNIDAQEMLGYPRFILPCTSVMETDILFGGNIKLEKALTKLVKIYPSKFVIVLMSSSCSIIGDDINSVVVSFEKKYKIPTLGVDVPGFGGDVNSGFTRVVTSLLSKFAKTSSQKIEKSVNIIGSMVGIFNWKNDLKEIKRLFKNMGIKVVSTICADCTLEEIINSPKAEINVVLNEEFGLEIARFMEKEYGIPYVGYNCFLPYGFTSTYEWFTSIGRELGINVEMVLKREEKRIKAKIFPFIASFGQIHLLRNFPIAIFGNTSQSTGLARFLSLELGMEPVLFGLKITNKHSNKLIDTLKKETEINPIIIKKPDMNDVRNSLVATNPKIIFGSTFERIIGKSIGIHGFVPFSYPVFDKVFITDKPYVAYKGILTLLEEIINIRYDLPYYLPYKDESS